MTLTRQASKDLKKALGRGGIKQLHIAFNERLKAANLPEISYETVTLTIRGLHNRQDIVDFAIEFAEKIKADQRTLSMLTENRIKALVEK